VPESSLPLRLRALGVASLVLVGCQSLFDAGSPPARARRNGAGRSARHRYGRVELAVRVSSWWRTPTVCTCFGRAPSRPRAGSSKPIWRRTAPRTACAATGAGAHARQSDRLSATFVAEGLALAWVEQGKNEARAAATLLFGTAPPALVDLGPAALSAESARATSPSSPNKSVWRALVMWRGLEAPCVEPQSSPCVGFTFDAWARARRRPAASRYRAGGVLVATPSSWRCRRGTFTTACAHAKAPTRSRHVQHPIRSGYARAEPLLKGCLPLGTVDAAGQPWLVADCHGKRRAVPVPLSDEKVQPEYGDAPVISCNRARRASPARYRDVASRAPICGDSAGQLCCRPGRAPAWSGTFSSTAAPARPALAVTVSDQPRLAGGVDGAERQQPLSNGSAPRYSGAYWMLNMVVTGRRLRVCTRRSKVPRRHRQLDGVRRARHRHR